jgi:hypothetical protein
MAGTAVITEIAIEKIATFICKSPRIVGQLPLEMVIGGITINAVPIARLVPVPRGLKAAC